MFIPNDPLPEPVEEYVSWVDIMGIKSILNKSIKKQLRPIFYNCMNMLICVFSIFSNQSKRDIDNAL